MINDQLATAISRTGAFGLANALQSQWLKATPAPPHPDVPAPNAPTSPTPGAPVP
jgi:hypothetical protein